MGNFSMSIHNTPIRQAHFTLLEILTAIILFAIIAAGLVTVFQATLSLREKSARTAEAGLPQTVAWHLVRQDLRTVVPPGGLMAGTLIGEKSESMGLRQDSLEFVCSVGKLTEETPWADLMKIEYCLESESDTDTWNLVRNVTRNLLPYEAEDPSSDVVLEGIESLQITYYDGSDWCDSWDSSAKDDQLPKAIRIQLTFRKSQDRGRPPLTWFIGLLES